MEKFKFLPKEKISQLPKGPGVYGFFAGKKILYIGKAINIRERVKQHWELLSPAKQLGYIETDSEIDALLLEARLIKKYQPKYNVVWKDDKNYFYVAITKDPLPRVLIAHQINEKFSRYIGPFVNGSALKETLKILRKIFPYYTQRKHPDKLCLWCHLSLCPGPRPNKKEYQKNIRGLIAVLERKKEMQERPIRMEGYDVSNIQGQYAAGSMVVFINGQPDKSQYRKFKIKISGKPNDVAMLKEVLSRRFKHPEWPYPDLILIDGGKAQLNAALSVRTAAFPRRVGPLRGKARGKGEVRARIISLAKKHNELFIENRKKPIRLDSLPDSLRFAILRLRDEAHRFAVSYHRKLRSQGLLLN